MSADGVRFETCTLSDKGARFEDVRSGVGSGGNGGEALRINDGRFWSPGEGCPGEDCLGEGCGTAGKGRVAYVLIACGGGKLASTLGSDGRLVAAVSSNCVADSDSSFADGRSTSSD